MTDSIQCIFCKISQGKDEKTDILYKDERLVVFKDIRPATSHHYLVVTINHLPDAKQLKYEHLDLVEQMVEVGKDVVQKQGGDVNDLRMGFHWPPFHMISHLHLHVISSTSQMGFIAKGIFMERAYWFAKVDWLIERLKKMKPPDTSAGLRGLDNTESPRMIKSHFHYFLLPEDLKQGCGKVIYVYRNPKAVVVSLYRLLKFLRTPMADSVDEFIELFLEDRVYGSPWAGHILEFWEHRNDFNVLVLQYEDILKDKKSTIRRIGEFLNCNLSSHEIARIDDHTDIESMRNNAMVNFATQERVWDTDKSDSSFINEGSSSSWKDVISLDHHRRIDEMLEDKLKATNIKFE